MKLALKKLLGALGYQVQGLRYTPRQLTDPNNLRVLQFDDVVCRHMFEVGRQLSFVQVGAFDGVTGDPLRRYVESCGWRGVMVEPQPGPAECLRRLYAGSDQVVVAQAAISGAAGERVLYTVEADGAPAWTGGLASFDRANIMKHADLVPGLERRIREHPVECVTFDYVFRTLGTEAIDVLQIDTEGADAYILSCFPFERVKPAIVHWEVKHLPKAEREDCFERLLGFGYRLAPSGGEDMLAVRF
jgi:FkbM family methyltransferase